MSTPEFPDNRPKKKAHKIPYGAFWAVFGAIAIVVSGLIIYATIQQNGEKDANKNTNIEKSTDVATITPEKIFSRTGNIESIIDNTISLKSSDQSIYKVTTTSQTELIKVDPSIVSSSSDNSISNTEEITFSDLNIGDEIIAFSQEDIKEKLEFEATKIKLMSQ